MYLAGYEFIANHALTGHFGKTAQCWVQYFNLVYSKCSIIQSLLMTLIGDFSSGKCSGKITNFLSRPETV